MTGRAVRAVVVIALTHPLAACAAAAAGAAGAATGIYLTSRGANGIVEGTVADVTRRTERVYADMDITITEREYQETGEVEIKGDRNGTQVNTEIEYETATTTEVKVEARENEFQWDQDLAREVVQRIVQAR
ncbi:MAG TPA: DUF3568 family protein [Longimicrobiales bacterium]